MSGKQQIYFLPSFNCWFCIICLVCIFIVCIVYITNAECDWPKFCNLTINGHTVAAMAVTMMETQQSVADWLWLYGAFYEHCTLFCTLINLYIDLCAKFATFNLYNRHIECMCHSQQFYSIIEYYGAVFCCLFWKLYWARPVDIVPFVVIIPIFNQHKYTPPPYKWIILFLKISSKLN